MKKQLITIFFLKTISIKNTLNKKNPKRIYRISIFLNKNRKYLINQIILYLYIQSCGLIFESHLFKILYLYVIYL